MLVLMTQLLLPVPAAALRVEVGQDPEPRSSRAFSIEETTITAIHRAFRKGDLTARQLVTMYLERIAKLDKPNDLKAFVVLNENALKRADALDTEFKKTGRLRPLHGIPVVVKDNYDTHDLQTAGGCIALQGSLPPDDCFMVQRIRAAGGIVLGKSNMPIRESQ